jgi:hypothetical protein
MGVPLRVAVIGNSIPLNAAPFGTSTGERPYPRLLEQVLHDRGVVAEVRNNARTTTCITDAVCRWDETVFAYGPDVVVVQYGGLECSPGVLPRWVEYRANGWHYHGGRLSRLGRRVLLRVWKWARSYQRVADRLLGLRTYRMRPGRFAWELRHFLGLTLGVGAPLVLVLDIHRFAGRFEHWIPNINARREHLNAALSAVVAEFPGVRVVPVSSMVDSAGVEKALSDGVHFTPVMHAMVADALADLVVAFVAERG